MDEYCFDDHEPPIPKWEMWFWPIFFFIILPILLILATNS